MTTGLSLLERIRQRGVFELVSNIAYDHGQLLSEVLGKSRKRPVVAARRAIVVALRERGLSLPEIGALVGRHHTSVMYLLRGAELAVLNIGAASCKMHGMSTEQLDPHEMRIVAVKAFCDPRTVKAYLGGKKVRPMSAARIAKALSDLGHDVRTGASE